MIRTMQDNKELVQIKRMSLRDRKDVTITYTIFPTRFGLCLVAATEQGVCSIFFNTTKTALVAELRARWSNATMHEGKLAQQEVITSYIAGEMPTAKIPVHLVGTDFQIKVWKALCMIPFGGNTTYGELATRVGMTRASRAIGNAVGQNPIGYLIPCHRVVRMDGSIGGYRWGVDRKRAMLAHEAMCVAHTDKSLATPYTVSMAKRVTGLKKLTIKKKSPKRTAAKREMLRIKAMKPADRKKALAAKKKK